METILENIKFPNWEQGKRNPEGGSAAQPGVMTMTRHPGQFDIERKVTADEALGRRRADRPAEASPALPNAAVAPAPAKKSLRRVLLVAASLAAIGAGTYYGHDYWTVGRFHVSTDDAYVQADTITIAPKISGYLGAVLVGDNEAVKAGQVLARVDQRDYDVALEQAKADVAAARATIAAKRATIDAQQSIIDSAKATVNVDEASQTFAQQENSRYSALASSGYGSVHNQQGAASRIAAARADVVRDTAALATAIKQVALQKAELAQAEASLDHASAVEDQAKLNLGYAAIVAPLDGVVGNRTLRVGQYVQAGTQLMSVVPSDGTYIVANYKETQLTDVKRGQPVEIEVDMFPGRVFHGHVDSLAPASGQTFALLPPDNATGNFTKVVQRIPVKITLDARNGGVDGLRPGMSVTPSIDTKREATTVQASAH